MVDVDSSKVYRLFYPSVPAVVSSSRGGTVSAMPAVSVIALSNDPPLVGFSSAPAHATFKTAKSSGAFSMCWLDSRFTRQVGALGERTGGGVKDKLALAGLRHRRGEALDVPVIVDASATLECAVSEIRSFGDHALVVGEVKASYADKDFNEYWQFKGYRPILYAGSPDRFRTYGPEGGPAS